MKNKKCKITTAGNKHAKAFLKKSDSPLTTTKTLKVRVKERHYPRLRRMARLINQVWNHCNEVTAKAWLDRREWPHKYEIEKLLSGMTKFKEEGWGELLQHSLTEVAKEHYTRRTQFKKSKLRWRVSNPKNKNYSLGWVPFRDGNVKLEDGKLWYGKNFDLGIMEDGYELSDHEFRNGSFNEDNRGRWYCNLVVKVPIKLDQVGIPIGIDPGRRDVMTASTGDKLSLKDDMQYPDLAEKLKDAQRKHAIVVEKLKQKDVPIAERKVLIARQKKRLKTVQAISTKIANKRRHALNQYANLIVRQASVVFIGEWAPAPEGKVPGARLARDGSLATLKVILKNKCDELGVPVFDVNEAYSTKTCSDCGSPTKRIPEGLQGLSVRKWTCEHCGTEHDRDVNAAQNICANGLFDLKLDGHKASQWTGEVKLQEAA